MADMPLPEPRSILDHPDPFAALGVRPFVNAAGPRTIHSGSTTHPRVRAAMERASAQSVDLDELSAAASGHLARRLFTPAGLVTSGCFSALVLAAAACAYGNDPLRVLPDRRALSAPKAALIPSGHRSIYDQAYAVAGLRVVSVATADGMERRAREENAACLGLIGATDAPSVAQDWIEAARAIGLPTIVDAAAERLEAPEFWTALGADLATYSCGKTLRGPHATGLLLGRADLVDAAWRHASPHHAMGRGYKVGKEAVIGALAAVDLFLDELGEASASQWQADVSHMYDALSAHGLACQILPGRPRIGIPRLRVSWDQQRHPIDGPGLYHRLDAATPRVILRELGARGASVEIDPACFRSGDADLVCEAILRALEATTVHAVGRSPVIKPTDLAGAWTAVIATTGEPRRIEMELAADGTHLSGHCRTEGETGVAIGETIDDDLHLTLGFGSDPTLTYRLHGQRSAHGYAGSALLGFSHPADPGPDRSADQYGRATFQMTPLSFRE